MGQTNDERLRLAGVVAGSLVIVSMLVVCGLARVGNPWVWVGMLWVQIGLSWWAVRA